MCDYHSICVRRDGAVAHVPNNSHSQAIRVAGWSEEQHAKVEPQWVECEWPKNRLDDGGGPVEVEDVVNFRNGMTITDLTEKQFKAIERHYRAIHAVDNGDITPLLPGKLLDDVMVYNDVYTRALGRASSVDKNYLLTERMTLRQKEFETPVIQRGGDRMFLIAGDSAIQKSGTGCLQEARDNSVQVCGGYSIQIADYWACQKTADHDSGYVVQIAGSRANQVGGGYSCIQVAGPNSVLRMDSEGIQYAGVNSRLVAYYDPVVSGYGTNIQIAGLGSVLTVKEGFREHTVVIDGDKYKPYTPYKFGPDGLKAVDLRYYQDQFEARRQAVNSLFDRYLTVYGNLPRIWDSACKGEEYRGI